MTAENIEVVSSKEALKDRIYNHCVFWCDRHLGAVPKHELGAALNQNIGIMPWHEWLIEVNKLWPIPPRNFTGDYEDKFAEEIGNFLWMSFQEQCLDFYTGVKQ